TIDAIPLRCHAVGTSGGRSLPPLGFRRTKRQTSLLYLLVGEQPYQRLICQISDLDTVSPGIAKITAEVRVQLEVVFFREFAPHCLDLYGIADHQAKMLHAVGLQFLYLEDRHELMLTQLAPRRAFTPSQHLQAKHIRVKPDGLFGVGHFDHDVVAAIDLDRHRLLSTHEVFRLLSMNALNGTDKGLDGLRTRDTLADVHHKF